MSMTSLLAHKFYLEWSWRPVRQKQQVSADHLVGALPREGFWKRLSELLQLSYKSEKNSTTN